MYHLLPHVIEPHLLSPTDISQLFYLNLHQQKQSTANSVTSTIQSSSILKTFIDFIQKLLKNVGVIGEEDEEKADGYKGDIDSLINAIKDAFDK